MTIPAGRTPALDGLRAIAILLVVPHNADVFPAVKDVLWPLALIAHSGWIGVQLFFVLSGFLITSGLLDTRSATNFYSSFYFRRLLRIFPLYFLVLLIFLVVLPHLVPLTPAILGSYTQQPWLWLFLNNWTQPNAGPVYWFPHFWSLAVEEQFYLLWPVAIAITPPRHVLSMCFGVAALAVVSRLLVLHLHMTSDAAYMFTCCRMDALALGGAAAMALRIPRLRDALRGRASLLWILGLAVIVLGAATTNLYDTTRTSTISVGYSILAAGMAVVVVASCDPRPSGIGFAIQDWLSSHWLGSVGRYSYAMYVFHMLIILGFGQALEGPLKAFGLFYPVVYVLVVVGASYLLGWASYYSFERHFLRLKRHFVARCDAVHAEV